MDTPTQTGFQRENQRISASEILQTIASGIPVDLHRCTISGDLNITRLLVAEEGFDTENLKVVTEDQTKIIVLPGYLKFNSCIFEGDVFFAPAWDKPKSMKVIFKDQCIFNSSVFKGQAIFSSSTFRHTAGFDGCEFEAIAAFRGVRFRQRAMYRTVTFNGYGLFDGSTFTGEASFANTCFSRGGNFTQVEFKEKTDFSGVYSRSKSVPVYESVTFGRKRFGDDETFWRFIKQASQDAGYYQLAGESFYNERCAHFWRKFRGPAYEDLNGFQKFLRIVKGVRLMPELVFGRWLFGYGEKPVRVLFAGAVIIALCALFYMSPYTELFYRGQPGQSMNSFIDGLYFSTITFTTCGFGDVSPAENALTRAIVMFEAISGALLIALFVVSLSKKYSRS